MGKDGRVLRRVLRRAADVRVRLQRELEGVLVLVAFSLPSFNRGGLRKRSRKGSLPAESMAQWWQEFDLAVRRRDWGRARPLAEQLAAEWQAIRGFLMAFVGPDADEAIRELDVLSAELRDAVGASPVRAANVEALVLRLKRWLS